MGITKDLKATNWKPVTLNDNILQSGIDGLIGIEECQDYSLFNESHLKKKRKRHHQDVQTKGVTNDNIKSAKKKKKTATIRDRGTSDLFYPSKEGSTIELKKEEQSSAGSTSSSDDDVSAWANLGLTNNILKALQDLGFTYPTEIQLATLPAAIFGHRDILGAAETGSGKTLAFGLPILTGILKIKSSLSQRLGRGDEKKVIEGTVEDVAATLNSDTDESDFEYHEEEVAKLREDETGCVKSVNNISLETDKPLKPLYALILTPTRELAIQVKNHLTAVAKYTGITIAVLVGGMAEVKQERILSKGPEIVVATPGRLWELIQSGNSHLSQINDIRFLAIDETDRMLERGHFQELQTLLERINVDEEKKKIRQNFVFSATLTLVHQLPNYLVRKKKIKNSKKIKEITPSQKLQKIIDVLGITNPKIIDITQDTAGTSTTLEEFRITCEHHEKDYYVYYFLKKHTGRTLIFCNSIGCVKRLTNLLSLLECNPLPLHASMQQRQRLKNLERFGDNENAVLIATDVAARGLDIPNVEYVLHYQTPRTSEAYVHRSGRTARASRVGVTVLLMEPTELMNYMKLCKTLGKSKDIPTFPVMDNYLNAVKERVNLARELDKIHLQVRKTNSEIGWFHKAAKDMDIVIDDLMPKSDNEEVAKAKKLVERKRKELNMLLSKEIFPKGFIHKFPLLNSQLGISSTQEDSKVKKKKINK